MSAPSTDPAGGKTTDYRKLYGTMGGGGLGIAVVWGLHVLLSTLAFHGIIPPADATIPPEVGGVVTLYFAGSGTYITPHTS